MVTGKAELISDTEEAIEKIHEKYPWYVRKTLPAGTYPGQDKELITIGQANTLSVRASLSEDQVYNIVATLFDDFDTWSSYAEADIKHFGLPDSISISVMSVPIHEGAIKYYKEKGFWTAEHEAKQQELLAAIP